MESSATLVAGILEITSLGRRGVLVSLILHRDRPGSLPDFLTNILTVAEDRRIGKPGLKKPGVDTSAA